jgi:hypothetical protein
MKAGFNVYGYRFWVETTSAAEALDGIQQDFAYFATPECDHSISIELFAEHPRLNGIPHSDAVVYTPRNVVYRQDDLRYIDYHGRALGIQDERTGNLKLYSLHGHLLYEATYLYLLSQIGQHLDRKGLHRLHALAVSVNGRAVLVLLPMGGGKSTLALHLLQHPEVQILSDDSPLIDRHGHAFAYPLRVGLLPGSETAIPPQHRRVIERMEFGPKHLVNYSYFRDRVCASAEPGIVFIGARTLTPTCRVEDVGSLAGLRACIANCVVGVGLFQGLEFILHSSAWELGKHAGVGASRLRNCLQLLRRSRVCKVHLGSDGALNARTLLECAQQL